MIMSKYIWKILCKTKKRHYSSCSPCFGNHCSRRWHTIVQHVDIPWNQFCNRPKKYKTRKYRQSYRHADPHRKQQHTAVAARITSNHATLRFS